MNGSPFMLQAALPLLVTRNRCTSVPAAPWPVDDVTVTSLVVHGGAASAVVVVEGGGAVVDVVVDVVTAGALGVEAEQPASTKAVPTTTDAVLAEMPRRVRQFRA
jgi:hypothetical protein